MISLILIHVKQIFSLFYIHLRQAFDILHQTRFFIETLYHLNNGEEKNGSSGRMHGAGRDGLARECSRVWQWAKSVASVSSTGDIHEFGQSTSGIGAHHHTGVVQLLGR